MNIVSFSGGKDSTAMLLRMIELNYKIDKIVFADTGFEFPELYEYIKRVEKYIGIPITILRRKDRDVISWFYGKRTRGENQDKIRGFPLQNGFCWILRDYKLKQLNDIQQDADNIYVGMAYDEQKRIEKNSDSRIKYPLNEWKWTEQDCVNYLNKKKLLNPLYTNMKRLGCWLCPKQSKASLYVLWKSYPNLWVRLKELEKDSPSGFRPNDTLSELEDDFSSGEYIAKDIGFVCYECSGVANVFNSKKTSLNDFI